MVIFTIWIGAGFQPSTVFHLCLARISSTRWANEKLFFGPFWLWIGVDWGLCDSQKNTQRNGTSPNHICSMGREYLAGIFTYCTFLLKVTIFHKCGQIFHAYQPLWHYSIKIMYQHLPTGGVWTLRDGVFRHPLSSIQHSLEDPRRNSWDR